MERLSLVYPLGFVRRSWRWISVVHRLSLVHGLCSVPVKETRFSSALKARDKEKVLRWIFPQKSKIRFKAAKKKAGITGAGVESGVESTQENCIQKMMQSVPPEQRTRAALILPQIMQQAESLKLTDSQTCLCCGLCLREL